MNEVDQILEQRQSTHGEFEHHAVYSASIKAVMRALPQHWNVLSPVQQEALDMIAHKMARVLAGDNKHRDHWLDIIGYAKLALDWIDKVENEAEAAPASEESA